MIPNKKKQIRNLLKGIETGDSSVVRIVNEKEYIQHNPQTSEGSLGLADLFKELSKTSPKVNIARIFQDNEFVFAHTEYDFANRNIGFEIFRFEDGQAVEHWDNIQQRCGPNSSGHSMVDGATEVTDKRMTETNRSVIKSFVENVLIKNHIEKRYKYITQGKFTEHNPQLNDDISGLDERFSKTVKDNSDSVSYKKCHRILAEGNFVLSVCEGFVDKTPSSFFDLYRLSARKIVEHWDTTEAIPPTSEWKNNNGKF